MLLKRLLRSKETELLDTMLMGAVQGTFAYMAVDVFAAIGDAGRIQRANAEQSPNAKKADAVPKAIEDVVGRHRCDGRLFGGSLKALVNAPRDFSKLEGMCIARFLRARHRALNEPTSSANEFVLGAVETVPTIVPVIPSSIGADRTVVVSCGKCSGHELDAMIGKFGPYGKCRSCGKNTKIHVVCEVCGTAAYLQREGADFLGDCETCGGRVRVRVRP